MEYRFIIKFMAIILSLLLGTNCSNNNNNNKQIDFDTTFKRISDTPNYNMYCWLIEKYGETCFGEKQGERLKLIISFGMGFPVLICNVGKFDDRFLFEKKITEGGGHQNYTSIGKFKDDSFKNKWKDILELLYDYSFFSEEYDIEKRNTGDEYCWILEYQNEKQHNVIARGFYAKKEKEFISKLCTLLEVNSHLGIKIDSIR